MSETKVQSLTLGPDNMSQFADQFFKALEGGQDSLQFEGIAVPMPIAQHIMGSIAEDILLRLARDLFEKAMQERSDKSRHEGTVH